MTSWAARATIEPENAGSRETASDGTIPREKASYAVA